MQSSEELFNRKLKALNGSMGHPAGNTQGKLDGGGKTNGTPAMPKMGVRARVTDWPPKKEGWGPNYETVITAFQNGQPDQSVEITDLGEAPLEPDYSDTKYSLSDLLSRSPLKGLHPIRQRSNSDVTISDIDAEDIMDQNAVNPNTGASLHREYGSTSSIDRQGLGNDGFFTMLRGYRIDSLDHRSAPPAGFPELLRYDTTLSPSLQTAAQIARGEIVHISGYDYVDSSFLYSREREKSFMHRLKSESSETSLFRKLRTIKSENDGLRLSTEQDDRRPLSFQKCFAHYDVQSILFNISEAVANRVSLSQRKNTTTGASAASQYQVPGGGQVAGNTTGPASMFESPLGSREDLNPKENLDADEGDGKSNGLVLSCPHFRNEIGGEGERRISLSRANNATYSAGGENCSFESSLSSHCTNAGVSVLEVPRESQPIHREKVKRYIIEHIDLGAYYYHKYFYGREHQNYFGVDENLGPVAISVRREKLDDGKDKEAAQYNYRVTFRTSQLTTLRGAILEDAVPSTARHGTARGLPLKEVLEYVVPELNIQCLRLAINSPRVPEQLLKLDEQGLSFQHKVGVLYCKAGQSTEEEMYNNENAGPALDEFLDLLGQRVRLKGFTKYRAQLDNKTDSTGSHSLYTTYKDYELMFHVSTLLPYTPNNRQQLLRKRHIGNDIVTIVFQEPGALPFTPKNIRSHFQHVFVIIKVHNPCTENVCYSVAVSRSKDVPPFGPPIPKGVTFPKSACVMFSAHDNCGEDIREIVQRLEMVTRGCETTEMTLRRNGLGQLGFHVNFEGIVADVEPFGYAWKAGLRQGSRLVEICKVAVATLTHEQMIDLLRTSISVKVVIIQPYEDGAPRRGCSELYRIPMVEYKNTTWHRVPTGGQPLPRGSPTQGPDRMPCQQILQHAQTAIPRSTSFDRKSVQDVEKPPISSCSKGDASQHYRSSPSNQSSSSDPGPCGGDKNSSHSSSNTLSSNASSSNSDEKHFGSGDLMDPEMLGLTYIKGASTDSGIDTAPCSMTPGVAGASVSRVMLQGRGVSDPGHPWTPELTEEGSTEEDHGRLYLPQSYAAALATGHAPADTSMGDLSEISSHSSVCGSVSCRQLNAAEPSCRLQDRGRDKLKDGGLQPNMSKEEYMKMMLPESPPGESGHRKASAAGSLSPRRSLYRTLSDESVCSNRKGSSYASSRSSMLDQAMPNDILFSSTPPYHCTLPPRISLSQPASNLKNEFWFSDGSLADRSKFSDPGLMPLPDTATGLDWSHLVDAARAFEDQRVASFCTMTDMQRAEALQISRELTRRVAAAEGAALEAGDTSPATLTGKVNQLEVILRQLQYDLKKEKEDKAILQVEVQHLRQDNMRLQEESQTAAAQLRKFTQWFFHTIDKKP
uniref:Signal induced proliferation associated 1 like 2 n=1 Tax=Cyprinus carpio TaxID=7962 RepID=A0A8C2PV90_CYPCA